jgi:hypothetical protein
MGGSTFFFFGGFGGDFPNCWSDAQNGDITNLYTTVGNQSIAAFTDGVLQDDIVNSDYDLIILQPATTYLQAIWSNWVFEKTPRDTVFVNTAVQ